MPPARRVVPDHSANSVITTPELAAKYEALMPLLKGMYEEFQELSKKKPDGTLNKRKLEIVNRLLTEIFSVVDGEPTRAFLDLLDEDDIPQNSDVALILNQSVAAMQSFHSKYYRYTAGRGQHWVVTPE